jgi:hypothetical protein
MSETLTSTALHLDEGLLGVIARAAVETRLAVPALQPVTPLPVFDGRVDNLLRSVAIADYSQTPFPHWQLQGVLPDGLCRALLDLPVRPRRGALAQLPGADNLCFDPEVCERHPVGARAVELFSDARVIATLEQMCDVHLSGSYLRLTRQIDTPGPDVGPHCDLAVRLLRLEIYLAADEGQEVGASLFDAQLQLAGSAWCNRNSALLLVPAGNTWHGTPHSRIRTRRQTLLVEYVTDAWRAKHELACRIPGIAWRPGARL